MKLQIKTCRYINAIIYVVMLGFAGESCQHAGETGQSSSRAYTDTSLSFERRAADLVSRMNLDEKISQMQSEAVAIPRLGIPYYNWSSECLHGIVNDGGYATVFPQAIAMAATWDMDLIRAEADVISTEARAWYYLCLKNKDNKGVHKGLTFWSPNVNIFRDPRWGRGQETYGEDPFLTARMGVSFVKGLQGNDPRYFKVIATPKHYAVHSGPEPLRHRFDARISGKDLFETYLPAFGACVKEAGAFSVMGAYSAYDGTPCCASEYLLGQILRKKWGFKGYVVSDCGAIGDIFTGHHFTDNLAKATALAVRAGCDVCCGTEYASLKEAIKRGYISEKEIDVAVTRLMLARMKLGMFDPVAQVPYSKIPPSVLEAPEHRELALKVARECMVLLKNQGNLLPLDRSRLRSVSVIGPYIMRDDILYGNYSGRSSKPVTFLQGIKNKLGYNVHIEYTKGVLTSDQAGALTTVPANCVRPSRGEGHGLFGEYFANPGLKGKPVFTRIDTNMVQYWDKDSPGPGIPKDFFSVRWTGSITAPESGTYILGIITDDRGRLYFDGKLVVDNWKPCEVNVMKTFRAHLQKGKDYKIRIDYADSIEYAGIRFQWKLDRLDDETGGTENLLAKAISITKKSDLAIVFAGISANLEGEEMWVNTSGFKGGDRTSLDLPVEQQKLIKALKATGKPIILVLTSGSALSVNWEAGNIPAILQAWYPGEEGGNAVADILFGDFNPAGRLPVTFYRSVDDLPAFEDYSMKGRTYRYFHGRALYPFGYGLSYTSFDYSNLSISKPIISAVDSVSVSINIKNTGKIAGQEVVQMYVKPPASSNDPEAKSLKGFVRVMLGKNESKNIHFLLKASDLAEFSEHQGDFTVVPGKYEILLGSSSEDIKQVSTLEIR